MARSHRALALALALAIAATLMLALKWVQHPFTL